MVTNIALVIQSMTSGGAERVMATLANNAQKVPNIQVHLIILTGGDIFYTLHPEVKVYKPAFDYKQFSRFNFTLKILKFLRRTLNSIKPKATLSFGGKYNSFVLLSAAGLQLDVFISERSRPGISYGKFLDALNSVVYQMATGIVAQTSKAFTHIQKKASHPNVVTIGNPIPQFHIQEFDKKEKIIINVGRFIPSKHQQELLDFFLQIEDTEWQLWFLGDGALMPEVKAKAAKSHKSHLIKFLGNQSDIYSFYNKASVFAFTSTSEGFPNSLGEALRAGCACISYDCVAGPSDLISDGKNGYLVPLHDKSQYLEKLTTLMKSENLRHRFYKEAISAINNFNDEVITDRYLAFMLAGKGNERGNLPGG